MDGVCVWRTAVRQAAGWELSDPNYCKASLKHVLTTQPPSHLLPHPQEVLQMAWLRTQGPDTSIQTDILLHLRTFANQSRMRRLLLGLMAANLSGSEANRLLNQFYSMDSDFSGTIELQELARVTQQVRGRRREHVWDKVWGERVEGAGAKLWDDGVRCWVSASTGSRCGCRGVVCVKTHSLEGGRGER